MSASGGRIGVGALLKAALSNIRDLDLPVRNRYRSDAQITGEWAAASHFEVAARTAATTNQTITPQG